MGQGRLYQGVMGKGISRSVIEEARPEMIEIGFLSKSFLTDEPVAPACKHDGLSRTADWSQTRFKMTVQYSKMNKLFAPACEHEMCSENADLVSNTALKR